MRWLLQKRGAVIPVSLWFPVAVTTGLTQQVFVPVNSPLSNALGSNNNPDATASLAERFGYGKKTEAPGGSR